MFNFIVVKKSNGEVTSSGGASSEKMALGQLLPDDIDSEIHLEQYKGLNYYWDVINNEQILRPTQSIIATDSILADGADIAAFSNVKVGSEVFINNISQGIENDGMTELTFDLVGVYLIEFKLFPYLDAEFVVNAI